MPPEQSRKLMEIPEPTEPDAQTQPRDQSEPQTQADAALTT
jgi:hypothetical protein